MQNNTGLNQNVDEHSEFTFSNMKLIIWIVSGSVFYWITVYIIILMIVVAVALWYGKQCETTTLVFLWKDWLMFIRVSVQRQNNPPIWISPPGEIWIWVTVIDILNIQTLKVWGEVENLIQEMNRNKIDIVWLSEVRFTRYGREILATMNIGLYF